MGQLINMKWLFLVHLFIMERSMEQLSSRVGRMRLMVRGIGCTIPLHQTVFSQLLKFRMETITLI
ncbi:hypothetical protein D2E16_01750 [Streptococcus suis]|nr:hypothetical protein D2E16_01750 [Streptococcus suis]